MQANVYTADSRRPHGPHTFLVSRLEAYRNIRLFEYRYGLWKALERMGNKRTVMNGVQSFAPAFLSVCCSRCHLLITLNLLFVSKYPSQSLTLSGEEHPVDLDRLRHREVISWKGMIRRGEAWIGSEIDLRQRRQHLRVYFAVLYNTDAH